MTRSRGRRRSAPRTTYCYRSGRIHPGGFVTATSAGLKGARTDQVSRHCNGVFPLARRFGSENPERRSRDEMALKVESVVDRSMDAKEALGGSSRLMRVLRPIILPKPLFVRAGQPQAPESRGVGAQLVSHQQFRCEPLLSEKLAYEPKRRPAVAAALHQHVEDLAFVVDGTPEIHPLAGDADHHFVQVPSVAWARTA